MNTDQYLIMLAHLNVKLVRDIEKVLAHHKDMYLHFIHQIEQKMEDEKE